MSRAKCWIFVLNNWTQEELASIVQLAESDHVEYLVFGREVGEQGTPHLQGYVRFSAERLRLSSVRSFLPRCHVEIAKGTAAQNAAYCKKDGDFEEFGTLPASNPGKRTDWERLREHITELGERPQRRSLVVLFPSLMARYEHAVWSYVDAVLEPPQLTTSNPRSGWQQDLHDELAGPADERTIQFYVDPIGNSGKTWFCQYMISKYPDAVQYMRIGKRDDMCYAIDVEKSIFLIDVPRGQMEYLQYSVLEQIKDRMIFSPKYQSGLKILSRPSHVVVFSNEYPRPNALSVDRVRVMQLSYATVAG